MEPLTLAAAGGGVYVLYREGVAKPAKDTQPEFTGPAKDNLGKRVGYGVIATTGGALAQKAPDGGAMLGGAAIGALVGMGLGQLLLDQTKSLDAKNAKVWVIPVYTGIGAIAGASLAALISSYGVAAALSGPFVVVVLFVLVLVTAIFIVAMVEEDKLSQINRWNAFATRKIQVVRAVSQGKFKLAMSIANEGAQAGTSGLGFRLSATAPTIYAVGSLEIVGPAFNGAWEANQWGPVAGTGLERDYFFPTIKPYDYDTYFGVDGIELEILKVNGAPVNVKQALKDVYAPQKACWDGFVVKNARNPTFAEWQNILDSVTDPDGNKLRAWQDAHDALGMKLRNVCIWIPVYLMQSPEWDFHAGTGKVEHLREIIDINDPTPRRFNEARIDKLSTKI